MNIKRIILEGEGTQLDFKKTITSLHKIAKTMVAFANNKGGKIVVGVMDDGNITGVKSEEEEKYMLTQAGSFYCKPAVCPHFSEHEVDGLTVLIAEIDSSSSKPHYALGEDKKWWVYIRIKDKSVLASKIIVDVLKKENENVFIEYSSKEKILLKYLSENERITLEEYCKLINSSRKKASRILVNLILSGLIRIHNTDKAEFYTAA